jgi:hypothetical protein
MFRALCLRLDAPGHAENTTRDYELELVAFCEVAILTHGNLKAKG